MAVLALGMITLYFVKDIQATYRFYKLQSSTATPPAKPTSIASLPPTGWVDSEPSYTEGSTNSLYTVDLTIFTDGSFDYKDVCLSSSYEAAKQAYNKASTAQNTANSVQTQLNDSRIWYANCTTAAGTVAKVATIDPATTEFTLKAGAVVNVKFTNTNSGAVASLSLNVNGTGNKPIKYINNASISNLTAAGQLQGGTIVQFTYDGTNWIAVNLNYNDTYGYENRIPYFTGKTGTVGIWQTSMFMEDANGTYQNICTASNGTVTTSNRTTGTTKLANTNGFKVGSTIYYCAKSYNANTNIDGSNAVYSSTSVIDSRYSFNVVLKDSNITAYKPIYLVGSVSNQDGLFYLDTIWWTQTPNVVGKVYILVGGVYDNTASNIRHVVYEENPWYVYNGEKLVSYEKYTMVVQTIPRFLITDSDSVTSYDTGWKEGTLYDAISAEGGDLIKTINEHSYLWQDNKYVHGDGHVSYSTPVLSPLMELFKTTFDNTTSIDQNNEHIALMATAKTNLEEYLGLVEITDTDGNIDYSEDTNKTGSLIGRIISLEETAGQVVTKDSIQSYVKSVLSDSETQSEITSMTTATLEQDGFTVHQSDKETSALIDSDGLQVIRNKGTANEEVIAKFTNDESYLDYLRVRRFLAFAAHQAETIEMTEYDGTETMGTGFFYIGEQNQNVSS